MDSQLSATIAQQFYTDFTLFSADLTSKLDAASISSTGPGLLSVADRAGLEEEVNQISANIRDMRRKFNDIAKHLPAHDLRSFENRLKEIEASANTVRAQLSPKTKFAFKRANRTPANNSGPQSTDENNFGTTTMQQQSAITLEVPKSQLNFTSHQYLTFPSFISKDALSSQSSATQNAEISISNLSDCIVNLTGNKKPELQNTAVHVNDVHNCVLLLGNVTGSVLVHGLDRCTVIVSCHQLRIHSSQRARFYVSVKSSTVIEACTELFFAGYPPNFPVLPGEKVFEVDKSERLVIQDFSHVKNSPSPNWTIMPEENANEKLTSDDVLSVLNFESQKQKNGSGSEEATRVVSLLGNLLP